MAKGRLSMRKIKEILRLKWEHNLSNRLIAKSCSISHSTVADYLLKAKEAGLSWPIPDHLDDTAIEKLLFPPKPLKGSSKRQMPSMQYLHSELKKKSVTLYLLWYEYKKENPEGYQYSQFCKIYQRWAKKLDVTLRQKYKAGEKLVIHNAGQNDPIIYPSTAEITGAQIYNATLGEN